MSVGKQIALSWDDLVPKGTWTHQPEGRPVVKDVVFLVDYGMMSHGLAPLFVDGHATEIGFWGLSGDIVRRLTRLNELYDRQINWDNPTDPHWRLSERDRKEFNALLPYVVSELQVALGDQWQIVVQSEEL
jgi:hypothetical protein